MVHMQPRKLVLLHVHLEHRHVQREGPRVGLKQLRSKVHKLVLGHAHLEAQLVRVVASHAEVASLREVEYVFSVVVLDRIDHHDACKSQR